MFQTNNKMSQTNIYAVVGRLFIALIFIFSGLAKISTPDATQGYIASVGLPFPAAAYWLAIFTEVGGGALLLLGYRARMISLAMAGFTITTALFFHNNFGDQNQMIHFMKNLAITGGLLQVAAFGAGAFSLDALSGRAVQKRSA